MTKALGTEPLPVSSTGEESRLRIMIAHSFYRTPGGEDRYARQQMDLLRTRHEVRMLDRSNESLTPDLSTAMAMTYSPKVTRAVEAEIARFGPDVIHLHNPYPGLGPSVHLAADRLGIPLVQTIHNVRLRCPNGLMFTEGKPCHRCESGNYANAVLHRCFPSRAQAGAYAGALWLHRFVMKLERKVRLYIVPSEFMGALIMAWGIPSARVRMIRNFGPPPSPLSLPLGTYGIYVGRLGSEKGVDFLLRALALAGDPPFLIVGGGPDDDKLRGLASALGLQGTTFTGAVPSSEVARLLAEARFLVMPSLWSENAPLAVLEALAAGKPVLASRTGGLPELLRQGTGLMCEPRHIDEWAANIRTLFEDDALCMKVGGRARAFAQEELSAERHLMLLEGAYREISEFRRQ
jgi:glycosyltransferase involved in cell wall biosynthesis